MKIYTINILFLLMMFNYSNVSASSECSKIDPFYLDEIEDCKKRGLENQLNKQRLEAQKAQAQKAQQAREQCLNAGKISACSLSIKSPTYVCGRKQEAVYAPFAGFIGYQWVDKFCDDNSKFLVSFKSKNNLNKSAKDVTYRCESFAKSGTVLGFNDTQIFDLWSPGEIKNVTITIPKISQTDSLNCYAKTWK